MLASRFRIGLYAMATVSCLVGLGWFAADVRASGTRAHDAASARVAVIASELERREVLLRAEGESFAVPWSALGYQVDRATTERHLIEQEPAKSWLHGVLRRLQQPDIPSRDVEVTWRFDASVATTELRAWAVLLRVAPEDAVVDFERHLRTPERRGRELNVEASLAKATSLQPPFDDHLELEFEPLAPNVTLAQLSTIDPRKVLVRFDTDFRKKRGPRIHNIRTAAAFLDGTVIGPGETLSFNRTVGARVAERGFVDAPVIVNDVMESGMGGGVCQVATALHAAALYGGLDIVERRSHSRPSGYASLGLDATVLDGVQDLRIHNPYDQAVYVRAYLPSRYVARVELLGVELEGRVEHRFWVTRRYDYTRRVVAKSDIAPGTFKPGQKGGYGYDTVSTVTHAHANGQRTEYRYKSKYYPVPEVIFVGPGTATSSLPPLPDGATDPAEVDGVSADGE